MHLFSENLAVEIAAYYRNLALGHGVVPKVFTLVNAEGSQYLFFIDDLPIKSDEENSCYSYYCKRIIGNRNNHCYRFVNPFARYALFAYSC